MYCTCWSFFYLKWAKSTKEKGFHVANLKCQTSYALNMYTNLASWVLMVSVSGIRWLMLHSYTGKLVQSILAHFQTKLQSSHKMKLFYTEKSCLECYFDFLFLIYCHLYSSPEVNHKLYHVCFWLEQLQNTIEEIKKFSWVYNDIYL